MTTHDGPYRNESHETGSCLFWTVRCDGSPDILNAERAADRLNQQHAEIKRLREELASLREATRWRSAEEELPDTTDPVLVYSPHYTWQRTGAYWPEYGWCDEENDIAPPHYWQPLPEPPKEEK